KGQAIVLMIVQDLWNYLIGALKFERS
ncbi:MAG: hypothetical protein K0R48_539, partial [Gammaproteobacteria bacterium]|nr:hypothetical protein [Gammaproteobacteria bacterium]